MGLRSATVGALGWRPHSGWAILVVIGASPSAPVVLHRERVQLLDRSLPRQPYHVAAEEGLGLDEVAKLISRVTLAAIRAAHTAVENLRRSGYAIPGAGVIAADRRLPGELSRILGSHVLLHAAEGQLYEHAIIDGCTRSGVSVTAIGPATTFDAAARAASLSVADLTRALSAAGKVAGPPWQKDHREAAAAAVVALAAGPTAEPEFDQRVE